MPTFQAPSTDANRLTFLKQFSAEGQNDQAAGQETVRPRTLTKLQAFTAEFEANGQIVQQHQQSLRQQVKIADDAVEVLRQEINQIWTQLRFDLRWEKVGIWVAAFYGLDQRGRTPQIRKRQEWITVATVIIDGDARAKAEGYEGASTLPALEQALSTAQTEVQKLVAIRRSLADARSELKVLRTQSRKLIKNAVAELRLALDEQTPVHRRQIMRAYGLEFVGDATHRRTGAEATTADAESTMQEIPETVAAPEPASPLQRLDEEWLSTISTQPNGVEQALNGHHAN